MHHQDHINQLTAHLFRENSGKMVAVLSRLFGLSHIDMVMDVVQDTFETALTKWRYSGIPNNPSGWLMQVAKNKALNIINRESKKERLSPSLYLEPSDTNLDQQFDMLLSSKEISDSQLRLLIACCHPGFSTKNQIIITLYVLCGFGVPEIAGALLINEEAVKKALARSKASLRKMDGTLQSRIFSLSEERVRTAQTILYLMFNEGYKTTRNKEAICHDLCYEAIRLTKLLDKESLVLNSDTSALLSLMFFNISRFPARLTAEGEWLTLEEQDRRLWNRTFMEEGYYYLNKATVANQISRFHLEAIIASLHSAPSTFAETDWKSIVYLYHQLEILEPSSPLITLNRIIAESYLPGTDSIKALDEIAVHAIFNNNFLLPAAKGDIYKRRGEIAQAHVAYQQALRLAKSPTDILFLEQKIFQCQ